VDRLTSRPLRAAASGLGRLTDNIYLGFYPWVFRKGRGVRLSLSPATPGNDCREYRNEKGPVRVITDQCRSVSKLVEISPTPKASSFNFLEEPVTNGDDRTLKPIHLQASPSINDARPLHVRRSPGEDWSTALHHGAPSANPASPSHSQSVRFRGFREVNDSKSKLEVVS
jgi:hypothetical protein